MSATERIKGSQLRIQKWTPSIKNEDSSPSTTVDETQTKSESSSSASEGSPGEDEMKRKTRRKKKTVADEIIGAPVRYDYSIITKSEGEIQAEKRLAQVRADTGLGKNIPRLPFYHTIMKVIIDKWDVAKLSNKQLEELVKTSKIYTVEAITLAANSWVPDCTNPDQVAEIVSKAQLEAEVKGVRMTQP